MLAVASANILYSILSVRFENDEFLKSKNTEEYEKLIKQIKVFKLKMPEESMDKKIAFFKKLKACMEIYEEIRARVESEEFLAFSSSPKNPSNFIDNLEENYLSFTLNIPEPTEIFNEKDVKWIKKNFKKFISECIESVPELVREFAEFNKGEIEEAQTKLIYKKPKPVTLLRYGYYRVPGKSTASILAKTPKTSAIYNGHYVLEKKYLIGAGIRDRTGVNENYIRLTNTIEIDPTIDHKKITYEDNDMKESFGGKIYHYESDKKEDIKPSGIAEGYNHCFNEEFAKYIGQPLIEEQTDLEKVKVKSNLDNLIGRLVVKPTKKNFEVVVLDHFKEMIDKRIQSEISATISYEADAFQAKVGGQAEEHVRMYFNDDNIISRIYDKIKIISRGNY